MKFSIITATNNSEKTLSQNISSVNTQSYNDIEHIFIDNNSSDNTMQIIEKTSNRNARVISRRDNGMYFALNDGLKLASGEVIGILNSDDKYFDDGVIKEVYETLIKHDCDLVWGNVNIIERDSSRIYRSYRANFNPIKGFEYGIMPPHPSIFIKKDLYAKLGNFNTAYEIASDYDLILRFIRVHKSKSKYIDKCFVEMKTGGKSSVSLSSLIKLNLEIKRINKFHKVKYNLWRFLLKLIIRFLERLKTNYLKILIINTFFKIRKEYYA